MLIRFFFLFFCCFYLFSQDTSNSSFSTQEDKDVKVDILEEAPAMTNKESMATDSLQEPLLEEGFDIVHFMKEDPTVAILVVLSFLILAVFFEKLFFMIATKGKNFKLIEKVKTLLEKKGECSEDFIQDLSNKEYGTIGKIVVRSLEGWNFGIVTMKEFSNASIETEKRKMEKRLIFLSTMGNNTPFIGLLGTVLGIMKAFSNLTSGTDTGQEMVMVGISQALIATAVGLAVAIPAVVLYNYLSRMVKTRLSEIDEVLNIIWGIKSAFEKSNVMTVQYKDFQSEEIKHEVENKEEDLEVNVLSDVLVKLLKKNKNLNRENVLNVVKTVKESLSLMEDKENGSK